MGVRVALFQRNMLIIFIKGSGSSVFNYDLFITKGVTDLFKKQNKTSVCWFICGEILVGVEFKEEHNKAVLC